MKAIRASVAGVLLAVSSSITHSQDYPELNLRLAHTYHATTAQSQIDQWWADEIRKRSGGKIKIQIFWAEALGKQNEMIDIVGKGAAHFGVIITSFFPDRLPLVGVTNSLPLGFKNPRQAQIIHTELVAEIPEMQEELRRAGIWPLFWHALAEFRTLCTKPITRLEDYRGLRMRSYGIYVPRMWEALGATPVTAFPAEIYEGLQRGQLDCAYFPHDLALSFRLHEVAKFTNTANFGAISTWPIIANYKFWQQLPDNAKKLIMTVSDEAAAKDREVTSKTDRDSLAAMVQKGNVKELEFPDQGKLEKATPDFFQMWVANMEKKGLGEPARRTVAYWKKRLQEVQ
jgi:TRAP-type C4-dicarboxylate transport system substrate-binding protein